MKELLQEVYQTTKKKTGIDPGKPGNLKELLVNDDAFTMYIDGLSEGLNKRDKSEFSILAENTRMNLLENSMFQMNPYETLTMPVLRVFYPKLVAREAVTIEPMNKPECVKAFLRAEFAPSNSDSYYRAPVTGTDISGGPSIGTPVTASAPCPSTSFDVLDLINITKTQAHLERDFEITGVSTDNTHWDDCSVVPAVEGHFSSSVTCDGQTDVISGKVDYLNGTVDVSAANANVSGLAYVRFTVTCSLEENRINPKVKLYTDKVRLYARDREISAEWTIHAEQDMRALFDLSMQAEIVNVLGQQISLDIDREIINALITANTRLNDPTTHNGAFTRTPDPTYTWGTKYWHENIIPVLNQLSGQVYLDTNIGAANTILANPLDAAILEDLQTFNYTGTSELDGDLGYRSATVAGGKWKVLVSAVVPQGTMVMIYKPVEALKATFIYAPYVPAILTPYPLGPIPSLTILSRYATALIRSGAIGVVEIGA
jgi:hypothetical protein